MMSNNSQYDDDQINYVEKAYREYKTVAPLEQIFEEESSPPHHLNKFLWHVEFLSLKIGVIICFEFVAVKVEKPTTFERCLVDRNKK